MTFYETKVDNGITLMYMYYISEWKHKKRNYGVEHLLICRHYMLQCDILCQILSSKDKLYIYNIYLSNGRR